MTNPATTNPSGAQRSELSRLVRDEIKMTNTSMEAVEQTRELARWMAGGGRSSDDPPFSVHARNLSTLLAEHEAMRTALEASEGIEPLLMELGDCLDHERADLMREYRAIRKTIDAVLRPKKQAAKKASHHD